MVFNTLNKTFSLQNLRAALWFFSHCDTHKQSDPTTDLGCKAMLRLHCHQDAKGWDCPICEWLHHAGNLQPGSGVVAIQEATWDVVNTSTARQDGCCVWVALVWPGWRWGWWLFSLPGSVSTDSVCWDSSTAFELGHAPWRLLGTYRPKPSAVYYFFFPLRGPLLI